MLMYTPQTYVRHTSRFRVPGTSVTGNPSSTRRSRVHPGRLLARSSYRIESISAPSLPTLCHFQTPTFLPASFHHSFEPPVLVLSLVMPRQRCKHPAAMRQDCIMPQPHWHLVTNQW